MKLHYLAAGVICSLCLPAAAHAQSWYAGGSIGHVNQSSSSNSGKTGAFSTGNGSPAVPNGTPISAGTPYGWNTKFNSGMALSAEAGLSYGGGLRSGIELAYTKADVKTHNGVNLAGAGLDGVDAAVLTGSATQLGATVGQVVATDNGDLRSLGVFANAYYDFNRDGMIQPYVGAGVGFTRVKAEYKPSGVSIIDGSDTVFAWQLKGGLTWRLSDNLEAYGEYAYRRSSDADFSNKLFPGSLEIENKQNIIQAGLRLRFG